MIVKIFCFIRSKLREISLLQQSTTDKQTSGNNDDDDDKIITFCTVSDSRRTHISQPISLLYVLKSESG